MRVLGVSVAKYASGFASGNLRWSRENNNEGSDPGLIPPPLRPRRAVRRTAGRAWPFVMNTQAEIIQATVVYVKFCKMGFGVSFGSPRLFSLAAGAVGAVVNA